MGMFLSITSVIGRTKDEVVDSLTNYAKSVAGGVLKENLSVDGDNCCVVETANDNTSIIYPYAYFEWDRSSEFISRDLNAPVFSFHIHDGDLWMYILFVNGDTVDQFNPIPDYWDENISEEEIRSWKGNAAIVTKYVRIANPTEIKNYLVRWDLEADENEKACPDDEFKQEDWQLLDFMKKLRIPYPLNNDGQPKGETYKLWTKELPLQSHLFETVNATNKSGDNDLKKPWWKFW